MKTEFKDFIKENVGSHTALLDAIDASTNADLYEYAKELNTIMHSDAPAREKLSSKLKALVNLDSVPDKFHTLRYIDEHIRYEVYHRFLDGVIK